MGLAGLRGTVDAADTPLARDIQEEIEAYCRTPAAALPRQHARNHVPSSHHRHHGDAPRELTDADADALHKVYGSEEATRHLSFEPRSMDQAAAIISAAIRSAAADPRTEYMLAVAGTDEELIGAARLATGEYDSATIGFALRPDQWGQGRGLETVRLLQRLGFTELGLHRIWGAR